MSIDPVSLAITAALTAASMAMTAMQRFKGPRLDDLEVTLADYGAAIPRFWGKRKHQGQIIFAERLREKKVTTKTKGGKFENYEYFGTWAVLLTDLEIDAYMRIWMDKHLVFQSTEAGPVAPVLGLIDGPFGLEVKLGFTNNMRLYLGTEDQLPDPRIEAWCEDRYGPDSCPAYRGSAYIVFEEIPLEKFGNRIPQVAIEATRGTEDAFIYEQRQGAYGDIDGVDPTFTRLYQISGDQFVTWDLANRTMLLRRTLEWEIAERIGMDSGGFYALAGSFISPTVLRFDHDGGGGVTPLPSYFPPGIAPAGVALKGNVLCFYPANTNEEYQIVGFNPAVRFDCGFSPTHYFADEDGGTWCVGTEIGDVNLGIAPVPSADGVVYSVSTGGLAMGMDNGNGQFLVWQGGTFYFIDKTSFVIVDTTPAPGIDYYDYFIAFDCVPPGARYIWLAFDKYDTWTGELLESMDPDDWLSEVGPHQAFYEPVSNAIVSRIPLGTELVWRYLDRVDSIGMTLGEVVDEVSGWCGVTGQDTSTLTQPVYGYSVTQAAGKEMISPLLTLHDVDPRPHDHSIQFVNRGSAPSGLILTGDFVVDGDDRYKISIVQDTDLPRRVTFSYADGDKDQQINTAIAQRAFDTMDSNREEAIDLSTYVEYPPAAQKLADRYHRRVWNSREHIENVLLPEKLALEPADVTTLSLDGVLRNVRLDKMTVKGMSIDCEFIRDETSFAALNASTGAPMEGRDPEVIFVPSQSRGFILDVPLLTDSDNDINPIIYLGAGKYIGGWPGASIYRGDDGTYDELAASITSSGGVIWGMANNALPTANAGVWDRGNTLNISTFGGTLTSVTEAEIDADPLLNLCAVGADGRWELLQFTTAVLDSDDTYTLSGFKRGRRGTEWAVDTHTGGDVFLMVNNLLPVEMGSDDVGDLLKYKTQTVGRLLESGFTTELTFTGASLKPYAPAVQSLTKDPSSGDITVEFDRRTRIGGNWNGSTIPLGEAIEVYEMDIYDGSDIVNTLNSSTPSITYSSADQTTDFGAPIAAEDLEAMLYQLSATVGRGFAAAV